MSTRGDHVGPNGKVPPSYEQQLAGASAPLQPEGPAARIAKRATKR
jgi:hypothetical protein